MATPIGRISRTWMKMYENKIINEVATKMVTKKLTFFISMILYVNQNTHYLKTPDKTGKKERMNKSNINTVVVDSEALLTCSSTKKKRRIKSLVNKKNPTITNINTNWCWKIFTMHFLTMSKFLSPMNCDVIVRKNAAIPKVKYMTESYVSSALEVRTSYLEK